MLGPFCVKTQKAPLSVPPSTQVQTRRACRTEHSLSKHFKRTGSIQLEGLVPQMDCGRQFRESVCVSRHVQSPDKQAGNGRNLICLRSRLTSRSRRNGSVLFVFPKRQPHPPLTHRPEIGRGYPLNLSISLSGGKETNQDSLSNGE
jgi:hypothetical protein